MGFPRLLTSITHYPHDRDDLVRIAVESFILARQAGYRRSSFEANYTYEVCDLDMEDESRHEQPLKSGQYDHDKSKDLSSLDASAQTRHQ